MAHNGESRSSELIGNSAAMRVLREEIARIAQSHATVLVTGETGVGKELVAKEIHRRSPRSERPFVAFNCVALAEALLESELFGHEKGAFTGANARREGRFEMADGGTLFLDEIGEISSTIQTKLLRVLQEQAFERVGGNETIKVDVRIIAATHRNLTELARDGRFREDFYYRIRVVKLPVPPLRERLSDIPLLAARFIEDAPIGGRSRPVLSSDALSLLMGWRWPGNVRQLKNVIQESVIRSDSNEIDRAAVERCLDDAADLAPQQASAPPVATNAPHETDRIRQTYAVPPDAATWWNTVKNCSSHDFGPSIDRMIAIASILRQERRAGARSNVDDLWAPVARAVGWYSKRGAGASGYGTHLSTWASEPDREFVTTLTSNSTSFNLRSFIHEFSDTLDHVFTNYRWRPASSRGRLTLLLGKPGLERERRLRLLTSADQFDLAVHVRSDPRRGDAHPEQTARRFAGSLSVLGRCCLVIGAPDLRVLNGQYVLIQEVLAQGTSVFVTATANPFHTEVWAAGSLLSLVQPNETVQVIDYGSQDDWFEFALAELPACCEGRIARVFDGEDFAADDRCLQELRSSGILQRAFDPDRDGEAWRFVNPAWRERWERWRSRAE